METTIDNKLFYRNLTRISLPIALQSLMLAMVAAADALMLGRVAQEQMTAVSLATQIQFVQNMFIFSATSAGAILGAQYWGKGDKKTLENIFNLMLWFCGIVSILFFAACELCPQVLMGIFTNEAQLNDIGSSYLRIAGWSYLITGVSQCYLAIMKVTEQVKAGAFISSMAVITNIIFNSIFIFGLFGAPRMEANGAALATTIARIIELALCIILSTGKDYIRPALSRFLSVPKVLIGDFAKQCLPLMGGSLCWGIGFTSYTAIMGHMGVDAAAANSIAAVVRDLVCCACNGIGSAAGIMVGNELGAGNLELGKKYGIKLKNISYVIGFISTAIVLAVTPAVVHGVILTDSARKYLIGMMIIMSIYMIGRCVNTVTINGVLDGGGDTLFDMYSLIVCMWMIAIPLALAGAFVFHWSPLAVYACTCLDEVGKIPWVMYRFRKYKWVKDLTR
ncbi:putative efflux protein, MATE family [Butyrivibrio hungatei DSM 14810]|uniref:Putative efflux protein, MATE family n=1 Tax=Butyrivibrio hungatei DSM 14810 TaxID=1121132 RepID=A0A1M7SQY4_9FIRM|nr:MATE family efflux transporter [Butyrivibrio hungatei]SHN60957.1 putative efflux protein, MATE family [Butyrivibrio hungatei DSM 14810]